MLELKNFSLTARSCPNGLKSRIQPDLAFRVTVYRTGMNPCNFKIYFQSRIVELKNKIETSLAKTRHMRLHKDLDPIMILFKIEKYSNFIEK